MKVLLNFCAVTYIVLLVLLETSGAPSCDCSKSDDEKLISHKIDKEHSKSTARVETEDIEDSETESTSKNGLVSGKKEMIQSRELSEAEIEKSRLAEEKKTTKGTEKSETDMTKKKLLSVSEKKSVLVYYMVSYRKLPAKHDCESRVDYYKRIFPMEDNKQVHLRKIFKCYEGEEPKAYIERVEFIFENVYPELDPRLDKSMIQVTDHYYTLKYSRKIDETDECYLPRVLKRCTNECYEHYKKRMECMMAALDEEDYNHVTIVDTETGYKIGCRKTPAKTRSSPSSTGEIIGKVSSSVKKSKEEKENVDASETSIKQKDQKGTSSEQQKNLKKTKTCVETEKDTKVYAYRVAYTKLPKKTPGELDECYYKKVFGDFKGGLSENERNELYLKMMIQYKGENATEYCQRIDFLFDKVYPTLDIRTNKLLIGILDHYYQEKYKRLDKETEEHWFERVLKKLPMETVQHYNDRVDCIQNTFEEDVDWSKVIIDSKTGTFKLASDKTQTKGCSCTTKSVTIEEIKKTYAQKSGEDVKSWYKRIVTATSPDEDYSVFFLKIYEAYHSLDLWRNSQYLDMLRDCYDKIYKKKPCESDDAYYEKLMKKYCFETDDEFYGRLHMIHYLNPNLSLWCQEKYYSPYTKKVYQSWHKKTCADTSDEAFFKKLVIQCTYRPETDEVYIGRVKLVRDTFSDQKVWHEGKYLDIVRVFYTKLYNKQKDESEESLYSRILKRESWEKSIEIHNQRVYLVLKIFFNLSLWSDEKWYEKYTKTFYESYYKKGEKESCDAWLYHVLPQLEGETKENAVKRVTLIKKSTSNCGCWTSDYFSKLKCSKSLSSEYLELLNKTFFPSKVQYEKKSSSSSSCASSAKSSEEDSEVVIKRGCH